MNLVATRWWSPIFFPSSMLLACLAAGLVLSIVAWRRGRRPGQARVAISMVVLGAVGLYLASTPLVATAISRRMESEHPPIAPESIEEADAIVVLGGAMHAAAGPDGTVHPFAHHASDRFETGLRLLIAGKAPLIAFGGGLTGVEGAPTEAEWNRGRALARGVRPESVIVGDPARYTSDEAEGLAEALSERGARSLIVVSSALHLSRAAATYRALGFEVRAVPCDFTTRGEAERFSPALLIPRGMALALSDNCAKEFLGRLVAGNR